MTGDELELHRPAALPDQLRRDPREDWPSAARDLYRFLLSLYGESDPLPLAAAGWIAHHRSMHTQTNYARHFRVWEQYVRECAVHPLQARLPLADAFAKHLTTTPTLVWRGGERVAAGPPRSDTAQAAVLSGCSSFYSYAHRAQVPLAAGNPFDAVLRPVIDPDFSPTEGLTDAEFEQLLVAARDLHRPRRTAHRNFTLLLVMYALMLRVGSALAARIEDLGYDRGHHTLNVRLKGGTRKRKPIPPLVWDAIQTLIGDRTEGFVFTTSTGKPLDEPAVWRMIRSVARTAGLPQADRIHPHMTKHQAVSGALEKQISLADVQDGADHKDPRTTRRYDRRRHLLDRSPAYTLAAGLAERLTKDDSVAGSPPAAAEGSY
ncbi:tyrosine-type recombinase/integrase [Streptacidiphilus fuscans]|uniref:Tyrosine-type recombinase/integrase n=1 Tax=Streptacidiphilus fuscans TaxID=2789292 RepID=A0A931B9Y7_9ACTN|nr:tyrosine-type recombinase/integrase [Streptacidiphilus fuscans]MBF9071731.1 tyrosine-type recombinase/integrase [Streptacidiphilus fuscans]